MFDWLYNGDEDKYNRGFLNLEDLWVSGSGTPRIEPKHLIKHREVQKNILKGAQSGMGSPEPTEEEKQRIQEKIDKLE